MHQFTSRLMLKWVTLHCLLGHAQVRSAENNGVTGEHAVCAVDKPMIQRLEKNTLRLS